MKLPRPNVSAGAVAFFGLLVYLDPYHLAVPFLTACICHELGHLLAIAMAKGTVSAICIRTFGAEIHAECPTYGRDLLATLAGPMVNLVLFLLLTEPSYRWMNLLLGAFNLLPLPSLDGGRALYLLCVCRMQPDRAYILAECIARLFGTILLLLGAYGTLLLRLGMWPMCIGCIIALRAFELPGALSRR